MLKNILLVFLGLAIVSSGGCRTLRDKFIREKTEEEAPVYVAFREYPDKPTRQVYTDYYLYTRGWLGELTKALDKGISHKRQRYAAEQALMNLEQIISFFNQDGRDAIEPLQEALQAIQAEINRIPNLSQTRRNFLIRKVQRVTREFGSSYSYSKVEEWLN